MYRGVRMMTHATSSTIPSVALFGLSMFAGLTYSSVAHVIRTTHAIQRRQLSLEKHSERKKSPIYTRTGDLGTSSLYNGERRPKTDMTFEALGHQDELNAIIGIAREYCEHSDNGLDKMLTEIQSRLFDLGAAVATPVQTSSEEKKAYTTFPSEFTSKIEEWLDHLDAQLPPLTNFVIPSGGMTSLYLNLARTICRRAERAVVPLVHAEQVDGEVGRYLNRLSDFLFVAARTAAVREGRVEILWRKAVSIEDNKKI